jgi:hypothetical protein
MLHKRVSVRNVASLCLRNPQGPGRVRRPARDVKPLFVPALDFALRAAMT